MDFLKRILKMFSDDARMQRRGFFTTFFKTTEEDYTNAEYVEIDIERSGNKVAPVLTDYRTGSVIANPDVFTEKRFRPPYSALRQVIPLNELMQRQPGEKDDDSVIGSWFARLAAKITKSLSKFHRMFKEQIELQCAQILQTGELQLTDDEENVVYNLDYKMKATHKPTVSVSWSDTANATPLADLEALCDAINDDGKSEPSIAIFGRNAWNNIIKNQDFKDAVKRDGMNLGQLSPALKDRGGRYMGYVDIGSYRLELWVYNDSYESFKDSTLTRFMDADKVVVTAALEDLDFRIVFGGVPTLGMKEPFVSVVPSEVTYEGFLRAYNRVWADENADAYSAESKCRPLAIPVSIDKFGCLTTVVA